MRRVAVGVAVLVLLVAARVAFAQQASEELSIDRETSAQLERIVLAARAKGLPTDPIVAKARQGALRHAPSKRIVTAAQAVSRRLEDARDALEPQPSDLDVTAGQDALSVPGVTKEMLTAIRAQRPHAPVVVAIGVMAQLVASGVKPEYASQIVANLMHANASDNQLVSFGNGVNRDLSEGVPAISSLNVRLQGLVPILGHISMPAALQALDGPAGPRKPRP